MAPVRVTTLLLAMLLVLLAMLALTSAFPMDLPVVRRAYYDQLSESRPGICGTEWDHYMKCYLCGKKYGVLAMYDRCCLVELYGYEINEFCSLITGNS